MDKRKFSEKIKEGISVQEIEDFARKYTTEMFVVLGLIIGSVSSTFNFFTGPGWTIIFTAVGAILGVFFPLPTERAVKQAYAFVLKQDKTTTLVLGGVGIVVSLFIPFVLFGLTGLMAGTAYHYYNRASHPGKEPKNTRTNRVRSGDELD